MDSPLVRRPFTARWAIALLAACLAAAAVPMAQAQEDPTARSRKGTKRPPAPPSSSQGIPAGTDSGTPGTSRGAELGLETMPTTDSERAGVKAETAAARAAARRKVPLSPDAGASGPAPMTPTVLTNGAKNGSKGGAASNGTKSVSAGSMAASGTATAKKDGKASTP